MNLDLFNPHIRHAKRNKGRFSVRKGISRCYDARLFYFENTEGSLTIGENKYNLSNKTAVFLPPLTRYTISITVNDATVVDVFNFDLTRESSHLITSLGTPTVDEFDGSLVPRCASIIGFDAPIIRHSSKISSHTSSAISSFTSQRGAWRERSSSHLRLALLELVDEGEREYSDITKAVLSYVSDHLSDASMTNAEIAAHFNYHPYYINRIIKAELGIPLRTYIIDTRLNAASTELISSTDSVSSVAERVGFSSTSYFVKLFREKEGVTPLEYRRNNRSVEL